MITHWNPGECMGRHSILLMVRVNLFYFLFSLRTARPRRLHGLLPNLVIFHYFFDEYGVFLQEFPEDWPLSTVPCPRAFKARLTLDNGSTGLDNMDGRQPGHKKPVHKWA